MTTKRLYKNAAEGENQGFQFGGAFLFILAQLSVTLSPLNDKGSALDLLVLCQKMKYPPLYEGYLLSDQLPIKQ